MGFLVRFISRIFAMYLKSTSNVLLLLLLFRDDEYAKPYARRDAKRFCPGGR